MGVKQVDESTREYYRLIAKLPAYKRRVREALDVVKQALSHGGTWAISFSGGKDSTSLLHICLSVGWRGPLFHFWYDETPTANTKMAWRMAEEHGLQLHLLHVPGAWDVYRELGHFFVHPSTPEEKKAAGRMLREYKRRVNEYVKAQGWTGQFLGLRKAESKARALMLRRKGFIYQTDDRETLTACPLANWRACDVWAYIFEHDLPYLEHYDRVADPERERSETTWLAAESLWRHGMAARLRRENPEEFWRLAEKWPEIVAYT